MSSRIAFDRRKNLIVDNHFLPMSPSEKLEERQLKAFMEAEHQKNLQRWARQSDAQVLQENIRAPSPRPATPQFAGPRQKPAIAVQPHVAPPPNTAKWAAGNLNKLRQLPNHIGQMAHDVLHGYQKNTPVQGQPRFGEQRPFQKPQQKRSGQRLWSDIEAKLKRWVHTYLDAGSVENNGSGLPCVAHSAVEVSIGRQRHPIHANRINFRTTVGKRPSTLMQSRPADNKFIAGQSPKSFEACEKLLLHAISSRQGVFQILTPGTHQALHHKGRGVSAHSQETDSIIKQLLQQPGSTILGGHYQVMSFEAQAADANHANYLLKVKSLVSGNEITVPLTQVGLHFDDAVLRKADIEYAQNALNMHQAINNSLNESMPTEPVIISQAGVGRNATVIVYNAMLKKIRSGQTQTIKQLDEELAAMICEGRRARGPYFVHSAAQLDELRSSLAAILFSKS